MCEGRRDINNKNGPGMPPMRDPILPDPELQQGGVCASSGAKAKLGRSNIRVQVTSRLRQEGSAEGFG
eukprot:2473236-Prorocentrum_lima.AAC.1